MRKKIAMAALSVAAVIGLSACGRMLDVIGDKSIDSFGRVLELMKEETREHPVYGGWSLTSPDGEASFIWSKEDTVSQSFDVLLEVNVQPFLDAGLDVDMLPKGMLAGDKLLLGTDLGSESFSYEGNVTPLASYEQLVDHYRGSLKYHMAMDHFGIDLMQGNMFEWAKDMTKNDKDIVYILDPKPFLAAGVDPQKVEGWVFGKVMTMDEKGKEIEVEKFLKPFDLDGQQ